MKNQDNVLKGLSPSTWSVFNFSNTQPAWELSQDGLVQKNPMGGASGRTGSLLVAPELAGIDKEAVALKFKPGSQYHSGVVFEFEDKDNYCAFLVNQYSISYQGFRVLIIQVKSGSPTLVHEEKFVEEITDSVLLTILKLEDGLSFYWNDKPVYEWQTESELNGDLGFYTQNNGDTCFEELLCAKLEDVVEEQGEEVDLSEDEEWEWVDEDEIKEFEKQDGAFSEDQKIDYLNIQPPQVISQVEFREVFQVPLDSFYVSLFESHQPPTPVLPAVVPEVEEKQLTLSDYLQNARTGKAFHFETIGKIIVRNHSPEKVEFLVDATPNSGHPRPEEIRFQLKTLDLKSGDFEDAIDLPLLEGKIECTFSTAKSDQKIQWTSYRGYYGLNTKNEKTLHLGNTFFADKRSHSHFCINKAETILAGFSEHTGILSLWDLETEGETQVKIGRRGVKWLHFVGNDQFIVLTFNTSEDESLLVVDLADQKVHPVPIHTTIMFQPRPVGDDYILVGGSNEMQLIELKTGTVTQKIWAQFEHSHISPFEDKLLAFSRHQLTIYDLSQPGSPRRYDSGSVQLRGAFFIAKGKVWVFGPGLSEIWDFKKDKKTEHTTFINTSGLLRSFDYSQDGTLLAMNFDGKLQVLNLPNLTQHQEISIGYGNSPRYQFSKDGQWLCSTQSGQYKQVYSVQDGKRLQIPYKNGLIDLFKFCSEDGSRVVVIIEDKELLVFNTSTLQVEIQKSFSYLSTDDAFYFGAGGKVLLYSQGQNEIQLTGSEQSKPQLTKPWERFEGALTMDQNRYLFFQLGNGTWQRVNGQTGDLEVFPIQAPLIAFSKQGDLVWAVYNQIYLSRFPASNRDDNQELNSVNTDPNVAVAERPTALAFSGDGKKLFTAHGGKTLRIWNMDNLSFEEKSMEKDVRYIQSNEDGTLLIIISGYNYGLSELLIKNLLDDDQDIVVKQYFTEAWFCFEDSVVVAREMSFNGKTRTVYIRTHEALPESQSFTQGQHPALTPMHFCTQLDTRPKRWYRQFKFADDEEAFYQNYTRNLHDLIQHLNSVRGASPDSYLDFEAVRDQYAEISTYRRQLQEAMQALHEVRDRKHAVVNALRVNGYNLLDVEEYIDEHNNQQSSFGYTKNGKFIPIDAGFDSLLKSKGYNFVIVKGDPDFREYQPLQLHLDRFDLFSLPSWQVCLDDFRRRLFGEGALSLHQIALFDQQAAEMETFDGNAVLQRRKKAIEEEIAKANVRLLEVVRTRDATNAIKERWQNDRQKLIDFKNKLKWGGGIAQEYQELIRLIAETNFENLHFEIEDFQKSYQKRRKTIFVIFFVPIIRVFVFNVVTKYQKIHHNQRGYSHREYGIVSRQINQGRLFFLGYRGSFKTDVATYLAHLQSVCSEKAHEVELRIKELEEDIQKVQNEILLHQEAKKQLEKNGLREQRLAFLDFWNDPAQFGPRDLVDNVIRPESDPMADLISNFFYDRNEDQLQIDRFEFQYDQFVNQDGLNMEAYLQMLEYSDKERIALFPSFTSAGILDPQLLKAVVNPVPSTQASFSLPKIKFVETHKILIRWKGFSLGELAKSVNLYPGEQKQIRITHTTELTRRQSLSQSSQSTLRQKQASSFETKLTDEFEERNKNEQSQENSSEISEKTTQENFQETVKTDETNLSLDFKMPVMKVGSLDLGIDKKTSKESTNRKQDTFEFSKSNKSKTSSKESRETFKKEVASRVKKISQETTMENKVEVTIASSEESRTFDARTEVVSLENPNVGRTLNFNYFQVQNNFEVRSILTDVKVVVDHNVELIKDSGITDVRVYNLEEIGKMIDQDSSNDPKKVLTAAIVLRQVLKNYSQSIPGIGRGNGALKVHEPFEWDLDAVRSIYFSDELSQQSLGEALISKLRSSLEYFKKVPFYFEEVEINQASTYGVNSGSYYLESEVGKQTALESYLEESRVIELKKETKLLQEEISVNIPETEGGQQ